MRYDAEFTLLKSLGTHDAIVRCCAYCVSAYYLHLYPGSCLMFALLFSLGTGSKFVDCADGILAYLPDLAVRPGQSTLFALFDFHPSNLDSWLKCVPLFPFPAATNR